MACLEPLSSTLASRGPLLRPITGELLGWSLAGRLQWVAQTGNRETMVVNVFVAATLRGKLPIARDIRTPTGTRRQNQALLEPAGPAVLAGQMVWHPCPCTLAEGRCDRHDIGKKLLGS